MQLLSEASDDARVLEVSGGTEMARVKVLKPWQGVTVNGEHALQPGEKAVLRHGDVLVGWLDRGDGHVRGRAGLGGGRP